MTEQEELIFDNAVHDFVGDEAEIHVDSEKLHAFLVATESIQMLRGERLRQLAIRLESEPYVEGWKGYYQIYEAAIHENPELLKIYTSIAVSGIGHWVVILDDLETKKPIYEVARKALETARKIAPEDSSTAYWTGRYYYDSSIKNETIPKAVEWFTRAIELDGQNEFAKLYRAHCLHDLHQWPQAITAYEAVNQTRILEENPYALWRVLKLKEQIAYCYAQTGQHNEAITRFHRFIDEVLSLDKEAQVFDVANITDLVAASTQILNDEKLLARTRELIEVLDLRQLYRKEFSFTCEEESPLEDFD